MKFYICVLFLAVVIKNIVALNGAQKAMIQAKFIASGTECFGEHPLSLSDIRTFRNKMLPEGDTAKCFAQCMFQKIGIMDDMGKLTATGAKQSAMQVFKDEENLSNVQKFLEVCSSSVNDYDLSEDGIKGCDRAKLAFTCLVENAPKFGFDVDFQ